MIHIYLRHTELGLYIYMYIDAPDICTITQKPGGNMMASLGCHEVNE